MTIEERVGVFHHTKDTKIRFPAISHDNIIFIKTDQLLQDPLNFLWLLPKLMEFRVGIEKGHYLAKAGARLSFTKLTPLDYKGYLTQQNFLGNLCFHETPLILPV